MCSQLTRRSRHDFTVLEKRKIQVNFTCFIKKSEWHQNTQLSLITNQERSAHIIRGQRGDTNEGGKRTGEQEDSLLIKRQSTHKDASVPKVLRLFLLINSKRLLQWPPSSCREYGQRTGHVYQCYKGNTVWLTSLCPMGFWLSPVVNHLGQNGYTAFSCCGFLIISLPKHIFMGHRKKKAQSWPPR